MADHNGYQPSTNHWLVVAIITIVLTKYCSIAIIVHMIVLTIVTIVLNKYFSQALKRIWTVARSSLATSSDEICTLGPREITRSYLCQPARPDDHV